MRVSIAITPELHETIKARVEAGESFSHIAETLHIHYTRMMKALRAGDQAWVERWCLAGQRKNGHEAGRATSEGRKRRMGRPGFKQAGFIWNNEKATERRALDAHEQQHRARMEANMRTWSRDSCVSTEPLKTFSPEELARLQTKLEGWVASHAGRDKRLETVPWEIS